MKLAEGFGPYQQAAEAVYTDVSTMPEELCISTRATYMTNGTECGVFALDADHVIKIPHSEWSLAHFDPENLEPWALLDRRNLARRVEALERGIGAAGLEQIVAYNLTTMPSVITERLSPVDYTRTGSAHRFTVQDYHSLCASLESLQDLRLNIDPSSENCLYEPDKGFTIIDYWLPHNALRTLQQDLVDLATYDNFDAYHNRDNARAYHQAITQRYGPAMGDPVLAQWHTQGVVL